MLRQLAVLLFSVSVGASPAAAQPRLPIFDTHAHYSSPAWAQYDVTTILRRLAEAGVSRAIFSSSPDEGTLRLTQADAARVLPMLRPYRDDAAPSNWFNDPAVPGFVAERLARGVYVGVGEVHLPDAAAASTEIVRRVTALVAERGLVMHVHSDRAPIEALYAHTPALRLFWAHAGLSEPSETVAEMLARHPSLLTEVSLRAGAIAPDGRLDPGWRALLLQHADRIMIGTDTWVTPRWSVYPEIVDEHRRWLVQLPPEAASAIAHGNAERLFSRVTTGR